jgi:hypothetical protein
VRFPARLSGADDPFDVFVDEIRIGGGSLRKGCDVAHPAGLGGHALEARMGNNKKTWAVTLAELGETMAELRFDPSTGHFADYLHVVAPSSATAPPLPPIELRPAVREVLCAIPGTNAVNLAEKFSPVGPPMLRPGVLRFRVDQIEIAGKTGAETQAMVTLPLQDLAGYSMRRMDAGAKAKWVLGRFAGGIVGLSLVIMAGVWAQSEQPPELSFLVPFGLIAGVFTSLVLVLIPSVIRVSKSWTILVLRTRTQQEWCVFLKHNETAQAQAALEGTHLSALSP